MCMHVIITWKGMPGWILSMSACQDRKVQLPSFLDCLSKALSIIPSTSWSGYQYSVSRPSWHGPDPQLMSSGVTVRLWIIVSNQVATYWSPVYLNRIWGLEQAHPDGESINGNHNLRSDPSVFNWLGVRPVIILYKPIYCDSKTDSEIHRHNTYLMQFTPDTTFSFSSYQYNYWLSRHQ
jgi:hypothetical protein